MTLVDDHWEALEYDRRAEDAVSYCRKSQQSDVYVIATGHPDTKAPGWWCCGCERPNNFTSTRQEMLEHLYQHQADGDKVPEHAIERLKSEIVAAG